MAKLPTAEALGPRPTPQADGGVVSYRPEPGGAEGVALAQVGARLTNMGEELFVVQKREQERIDKTRADDALNQLIDAEQDLTNGEGKGYAFQKGGNAVSKPLHRDYMARLADAEKLISQGLGNDRQREYFRQRADTVRHRFNGNLQRHVAHEGDVYAKQVFLNTRETELANIGANFNNDLTFATSVNRYRDAAGREADRQGLQELKDRELRLFLDEAWKTRLNAERMVDPVGALARFQENTQQMSPGVRQQVGEALFRDAAPVLAADLLRSGKAVAPDDAQALAIMKDADALKLPLVAEVKPGESSVLSRLPADQRLRVLQLAHTQGAQDAAQAREGLSFRVQDATEALERGLVPTNVPSADELTRAFGTERGGRLAQSLANARQFGQDVASVATMSRAEMGDLLASRQPQPGPGFAVEQKRQDELRGAVGRVLQERDKDPAAFALQYAPTVKRAYEDMVAAPSPASAQAFATATLAEQKRLGVAEPAILPKAQADQLSRQFADTSDGAQKPAQLVQKQAEQWGPYWPHVYRQIAKDIGPTARVVSNLRDTPAAALLSMNAKVTTNELKRAIAETDAKDVNEAIDTQLAPFKNSLIGWTTGGTGTYNDFEEAARRNAYVYRAQGGKSGDAAVRAVRELVDDYYDFRGRVRIPKASGADVGAVDRGMTDVLKSAGDLKFRVPEAEAKLLGPEFVGKQLGNAVKNRGFFVTLGDDSGVALFMEGSNGARALEGEDGRPITFTWRDLQDRAREAARKPGAVNYGETDVGAVTGRTVNRGAR